MKSRIYKGYKFVLNDDGSADFYSCNDPRLWEHFHDEPYVEYTFVAHLDECDYQGAQTFIEKLYDEVYP